MKAHQTTPAVEISGQYHFQRTFLTLLTAILYHIVLAREPTLPTRISNNEINLSLVGNLTALRAAPFVAQRNALPQ